MTETEKKIQENWNAYGNKTYRRDDGLIATVTAVAVESSRVRLDMRTQAGNRVYATPEEINEYWEITK